MTQNDTLLRTVLLVLVALLLIPILLMVLMMPMMGAAGWSHMWGDGAWSGTGVWLLLVMMIVPLLILAGLGYVLFRGLAGGTEQQTDSALEELRIAYARGDLSDEEFERRRKTLRENE